MTFDGTILANWARRFDVDPDVWVEPGWLLRPRTYDDDAFGVHLWQVGRKTVVCPDHDLVDAVTKALDPVRGRAVTIDDLLTTLPRASWTDSSTASVWYRRPAKRAPHAPPDGVLVRALGAPDAAQLASLEAACAPEETDEAYVGVDHTYALGAFEDGSLLACASGYEFAGFLDLGVLTHPSHRRRGLGAAVVDAVCRGAEADGWIPQYRHADSNLGSAAVPRRLDFERRLTQESVWLRRPAD